MRWLAGLRCGRVRKRRWRYLDNTLSARERAWVDRHLERCIGCRTEFARAAFAIESLQKGLMPEPNLLPSRPKRWVAILPLLALVGLVGGLWLARLYGSARQRSRPPVAIRHSPSVQGSARQQVRPPAGEFPSLAGELPGVPKRHQTVRQTPRPPTTGWTRVKSKTPSSKKHLSRQKVASPRQRNTPSLPEGAVEVFDESGQLVKREQMRGKR